jgi:hypothetical protein
MAGTPCGQCLLTQDVFKHLLPRLFAPDLELLPGF